MLKRILCFLLLASIASGVYSSHGSAQTLSPQAEKVKAKVEKRAAERSKTKVKMITDAVYVGTLSDVSDTSFAVTDKTGNKHSLKYSEVKSVEGTGGIGWRIGLGAAIGAAAVLGVLAAIIVAND